jgi:hypothetical protein
LRTPSKLVHGVIRLGLVSRGFLKVLLHGIWTTSDSSARSFGTLSTNGPWDGFPGMVLAATWVDVARAFEKVVLHNVILVRLSDVEDTGQDLL